MCSRVTFKNTLTQRVEEMQRTPPLTALINKGQLAIMISLFNQPHVALLGGLSFDNQLSASLLQYLLLSRSAFPCFVSRSSALPISYAINVLASLFLQPLPSYRIIPPSPPPALLIQPPYPSLCIPSLALSDECIPSLISMLFLSLCSSTGLQTSR